MIEIDRHKIYESHGYRFKNYVLLTDDEKFMVLQWRNHVKVRNVMLNKEIITIENHLLFIEELNKRNDCYYWLVIDPFGLNVGVLDITHINRERDQGEIGFYLNPTEAGKGFDFMIECDYFVFAQLKLKNNVVTVNANNRDILLFHKFIGETFESVEEKDDEVFLINRHSGGDYLLQNYLDLTLASYAKFVKNNKHNDKLFKIKNKYYGIK